MERVPKETNRIARPAVAQRDSPMRAPAAKPGLRWAKLPEGWQPGVPSAMRVATFAISGAGPERAEVAVTPLIGVTGIGPDSVNMWRGELGLPTLEAADAEKLGEAVRVGDAQGKLYDFNGTIGDQASRVIGTVVERDGATWFFKMHGSDALVAAQKAALISFLSGVEFTASGAEPSSSGGPGASPSSATGAPGPALGTVPGHWRAVTPGQMLLARYLISEPGSPESKVTVSQLGGDAGGLLANVNRWRRELKLEPVSEAALGPLTRSFPVAGRTGTLVELKAPQPNDAGTDHMLVLMVPVRNAWWFIKLTGPTAVVERERAAFLKYVATVPYEDAA